jgi:hypothetical protein
VELSADEARLIVAALQQFEPYWPSDLDDLGRAELLAEIRHGIEHVLQVLGAQSAPTA